MPEPLRRIWDRVAVLLGTGLGLGLSPIAPGTLGSLWGLLLVWGLDRLQLSFPVYLLAAGALIAIGIPICSRAARQFNQHDPGQVVFDEIVAFPVVFSPLIFFGDELSFTTCGIGFFWFRVFDVVKPWPVKRLEQLPGGLGIVVDDLVAGLYAALAFWWTVRWIVTDQ